MPYLQYQVSIDVNAIHLMHGKEFTRSMMRQHSRPSDECPPLGRGSVFTLSELENVFHTNSK